MSGENEPTILLFGTTSAHTQKNKEKLMESEIEYSDQDKVSEVRPTINHDNVPEVRPTEGEVSMQEDVHQKRKRGFDIDQVSNSSR